MPVYAQRPGNGRLVPGAALRRGAVRPVRRLRHLAAGRAGPGVQGQRRARAPTRASGDGSTPTGKADNPAALAALDDAATAYADAQKALTAGNLGEYQTKINEMQDDLTKAQRALGR